jgi:putative SOS response-associated peptidase YedK
LKSKPKKRYGFTTPNDEPFLMAGVWDRWEREGNTVESCSLITTSANETVGTIHDRMPVILHREAGKRWLDPKTPLADVTALLVPYTGELITAPAGND